MRKQVRTDSLKRADRFIAALIERVVFCVAKPVGASHDGQSRFDGPWRFDQIRATHGAVGIDAVPLTIRSLKPRSLSIATST